MAIGPASASEEVYRLIGGSISNVIAWLDARLAWQGLATQVFVYPLVAGERMAAGFDLQRVTMIDSEVDTPDTARRVRLQLGGWSGDVEYDISPLEDWASAGGVAPRASLGHNLLDAWILHWLPERGQVRLDRAATDMQPGRTAPPDVSTR